MREVAWEGGPRRCWVGGAEVLGSIERLLRGPSLLREGRSYLNILSKKKEKEGGRRKEGNEEGEGRRRRRGGRRKKEEGGERRKKEEEGKRRQERWRLTKIIKAPDLL
jgi:hypothetical protein